MKESRERVFGFRRKGERGEKGRSDGEERGEFKFFSIYFLFVTS